MGLCDDERKWFRKELIASGLLNGLVSCTPTLRTWKTTGTYLYLVFDGPYPYFLSPISPRSRVFIIAIPSCVAILFCRLVVEAAAWALLPTTSLPSRSSKGWDSCSKVLEISQRSKKDAVTLSMASLVYGTLLLVVNVRSDALFSGMPALSSFAQLHHQIAEEYVYYSNRVEFGN